MSALSRKPPTPDDTNADAEKPRARRGRPAKLSHEAIVAAALALLQRVPLDDIGFATVARELGVSTMSLYSYFAHRDALLEAVAQAAFSELVLPHPAGLPWREALLGWLWAVQRHFERYPAVAKTLGWNGHIPQAWLRTTVPVIDTLREQGLAGGALAGATHWFLSSAVGLMVTEASAEAYRQPAAIAAAATLSAAERASLEAVTAAWRTDQREPLLALSFELLLDTLERLLTPQGRQRLSDLGTPRAASRRKR
jgi:AcrR family transcriptional regulator